MKNAKMIFAGSLLMLLNLAVAGYAQEDQNGVPKSEQKSEARPAEGKSQETLPAQEDKKAGQDQKKDEHNKAADEKGARQDEKKQQDRATASGTEPSRKQATQHIPDEKFRASFGHEHHFRVSRPVVVDNHPRFQYSGYWFEFVDAWPVDWSYSDDCYIDYIDGQYFLIDLFHPDVRLALVVAF